MTCLPGITVAPCPAAIEAMQKLARVVICDISGWISNETASLVNPVVFVAACRPETCQSWPCRDFGILAAFLNLRLGHAEQLQSSHIYLYSDLYYRDCVKVASY